MLEILCSVTPLMICSYLAGRGCYEVKDADDPLKCVEVPADSVIRLTDGGQGFAKGDNVSNSHRVVSRVTDTVRCLNDGWPVLPLSHLF